MADSFIDLTLPDTIPGLPCNVGPRFSTRINLSKSGSESRNQNWASPLRKFMLPEAVSDQPTLEEVMSHWMIMGGPHASWPFQDPFEFASVGLDGPGVVPETSGIDQALGVGDGFLYQFQMVKVRELGGFTFSRTIVLPVLDTIDILIDGVDPSAASGGPYTITSITRPGGMVTVSPVPTAGRVLTWGGLFDTEVRWDADDSFDAIAHSLETVGASPLNFVEVRRC